MSQHALPIIKPYHPATFLDRGVAVPFTTPLLGGTRARPAGRQSLELIIPNPSGGRGAYIMPWSGIASICRPTLHDHVFNERIAGSENVTPVAIRRIARQVAAEGLAGEQAMAAAQGADDAERNVRMVMNYKLLVALVAQVADVSLCAEGGDPATRARMTVDWISPRLGQTPAWTADALEALASIMVDIGVGPVRSLVSGSGGGTTERIPSLLAMLARVREDVAAWGTDQAEEDQAAYVRMICTVADLTLSLAAITLRRAQALTEDMVGLLRAWAADRAGIVNLVARPDWMLDGWEQICMIWNHATDQAMRRAALIEIVSLVPILPREAIDWTQGTSDAGSVIAFRRMIPFNQDWRTGALVYALVARNEQFRARACLG
nr:hypothetical protein [uncultured Lichenicoccus sp.]